VKERYMQLDSEIVAKAKAIVTYAQEHPFTTADLVEFMSGKKTPVGLRPEYHMHIPQGFKVVYSWEQQPPPLSWCVHMSFSVDEPGSTPNPQAVDVLLGLFEVNKKHTEANYCYVEDLPDGYKAVNLIFKT
jgi:hypothetical protein